MKIHITVFTSLFLLLFSCNKSANKNEPEKIEKSASYDTDYNNKELMIKLLDSALIYGDTSSYKKAFKYYVISNHYEEFLYYSIKMSEKHDFSEAYFDTYYLLNVRENDTLYKSNDLANFYLFKAYEKGSSYAKDQVEEMYPDKKSIPKSSDYLNTMSKW